MIYRIVIFDIYKTWLSVHDKNFLAVIPLCFLKKRLNADTLRNPHHWDTIIRPLGLPQVFDRISKTYATGASVEIWDDKVSPRLREFLTSMGYFA